MNLKIALAQTNMQVGNISANIEKIMCYACKARDQLNADIIVFPELTITGYPPEDLLFRADFISKANNAIVDIARQITGITIIVGFPERAEGILYNSAAVLGEGIVQAVYRKNELPNYGVFDEKRYFQAGCYACVITIKGVSVGITLCEDIWVAGVVEKTRLAGAEILINLNASPYCVGKIYKREQAVRERIKKIAIPVIFVNQVGGQDELVFDGASFVSNCAGEVVFRAEAFKEQLHVVEFDKTKHYQPLLQQIAPIGSKISSIYQALVLGVRDYVKKNGFQGVVLGLSGGIDSALTLALAVDALGKNCVVVILLPSKYTRPMSLEDAKLEAQILGVQYHIIAIEKAVVAFDAMLLDIFSDNKKDATAENIQARCRGIILMAYANKQDKILLTTGNKSEMSVGYATLYGDMAGGFAPLKDVSKLRVYALAKYRNTLGEVIPQRIITREPSAELAEDQVDVDTLPAYDKLDFILERYIELEQNVDEIIAAGFTRKDVHHAINMVDRNEYKRRQSPPGIKITSRAFGRDRRYPISSGYRGV